MTRTAPNLVLTLPAGSCRLMRVASGCRWTATAGRVRLTGPLCELGGRVVAIDVVLSEGGSEVVDPGG